MTTAAQRRAAIHRATQDARLRSIARREARVALVEQAYQDTAAQVAGWLRAHVGSDGRVPAEALAGFDAFLSALLRELDGRWHDELSGGLVDAATLAAAVAPEALAASVVQRALLQLRDFVAADGLQLADRVWRVNDATRRSIVATVRGAIERGATARMAATELLLQGQAVPSAVALLLRDATPEQIAGKLSSVLMRDRGNPLRNALRIMRTEINRAHTESFVNAAFEHPDVAAVKFNLSINHPRLDQCFRAGTPVATSAGPRSIEEVEIGDLVLTHRGRYMPVTRLYRSAVPAGSLLRLGCQGGSNRNPGVVLTPNHPVLTPEGWKAAADLQTGSLVACVHAWLQPQSSAPQCCAPGTGVRDSVRSGRAFEAGSSGAAQCDAGQHPSARTPHRLAEGSGASRRARTAGAGTSRWWRFLRTTLGSLRQLGLPTFSSASPLASATTPCGACRSSGCPCRASAGSHESSISHPCCNSSARMTRRMWCKLAALWRAPSGSTRHRRSNACAPGEPTALRGENSRRTCRTLQSEPVSYVECSMQRLHTSGETVFNFEVADDHSYVAGGFVVHNCDGHAAANLHGMGPGVYPRGQHPYPAHPETLSYLTVVFVDQITAADRAGQQTMGDWLRAQPAGLQDAVLGQHKGAALRDGQLLESEITTPWRDVRARLEAPP